MDAFTRLNIARQRSQASPHKPCMLLAVIDLARAGALEANEIRYLPPLLERYREYFTAVATERDHLNPYFPFFHLRSEGFWHLQPRRGKRALLEAIKTARSHSDIIDVIDHASLDANLHALLQERAACAALSDQLISRWFPQGREAVWVVRERHGASPSCCQAANGINQIAARFSGGLSSSKIGTPGLCWGSRDGHLDAHGARCRRQGRARRLGRGRTSSATQIRANRSADARGTAHA
jgi:hypothetical protein